MQRKILSGVLCCLIAVFPQSGWSVSGDRKPYQPPPKQLAGAQRIEFALERLTFGPRPGELQAVKEMGLDQWFEHQLHPEQLDESALNARLADFPSIANLSVADLMLRFPDQQRVRQAMNSKAPMPENVVERKVYEVQAAIIRDQEAAKSEEKKQTENASPAMGMLETPEPPPTANSPADIPNNGQAPLATQQFDKKEQKVDLRARYEAAILRVLGLQPEQRVKALLAMSPEDLSRMERAMRPQEKQALLAGLSPDQHEVLLALDNSHEVVVRELVGQRIIRDIDSNAQLNQVMVDFWLNHFNIFINKNPNMPYYLVGFERDVIRPRALGNFEDLLEATAHSPAMMLYLDNASSIGPHSEAAEAQKRQGKNSDAGLNENYARELMELHTVGVNGGYTQADVTEVARILTGWGVDRPGQGGDFRYFERRHEPGTKTVMGEKYKESGEDEGRALLHFLATRPATAQFISRKLAVRFVSDDPPQALVDRMAQSFLASNGDIKTVLRTMFHSPEFWSAENYRAKLKTPEEFVISAVRVSGLEPQNPQPLVNAIRNMGMPLYGAVPPTGYSWKSDAWLNTGDLVYRMNFALSLAQNRENGCTRNWSIVPDAWNGESPVSIVPAEEETRIEYALMNGGLNATTRNAILSQLHLPPPPNSTTGATAPDADAYSQVVKLPPNQVEAADEMLAGYILGSPEFQRR